MIHLLLSLGLVFAPSAAATPPRVDAHLVNGVRAIYEMDFDGADAAFAKAKAAIPDYPFSYFGSAIVSWARFVYGSQQTDPKLEAAFEREVEGAVVVAKAWMKVHPRDAEGYLSLSGSYGLRSRLSVRQRRWFRALFDGRRAIKYARKAHSLDPELHDALLGIGMYDYYADALPRAVGFFSKLFLGGDRERGIRELEKVAAQGKFSKIGGQLLLLEIYTEDRWGARDPEKALAILRPLRRRFSKSPLFHQIETICLYEAGRFDELIATTKEYQKRIDEAWPYYREMDRARMHVSIGTARFAQQKLGDAERAFRSAGELAGTKDKPNRWGVWGLIRLGHVRDALKRREEALESYRAALGFPDIWGFRGAAKRGLKRPVVLNPHIGQLPPP